MNSSKTPILPVGVRISLIIVCYVVTTGIFEVIGGAIMGVNLEVLEKPENIKIEEFLILQAIVMIDAIIVVFSFRKYSDLRSIHSLGFKLFGKVKDIFCGALVAVIIIGNGTLINLLSKNLVYENIKFDNNNFICGLLLFFMVAISEEILFRGYILNNLMSVLNRYFALLISSVLFALMHSFNLNLNWIGMLNLFLLGILLGSTYIYTKNLWFPISLHLFWNFIQGCVFDYNVSGLNVNSIFKFDMPIKNSFNGGDFGFEGSWLCTLLSSCVIFIILYYYKRQNKPTNI